jgi:hypothetical protein
MPLTVTLTLSAAHAEEKRPVAKVMIAQDAMNLIVSDFMMKSLSGSRR